VTADVVIVNATLVAPAGIVTDAGVVAADARLLEMAMMAPPVGAAGAIEIAPCADDPPSTVDGTIVTDVTPAGCGVNVSVAVTLALWKVAVSTTLVGVATATVVTSTCALVAPAGTITLCGTEARLLADDSATIAPPVGAGAASVMTAFVVVPPTIDAALSASADSVTPAGVIGDLPHAAASSATDARDTKAMRSLMFLSSSIAMRAS
jgi:hypothetical protein